MYTSIGVNKTVLSAMVTEVAALETTVSAMTNNVSGLELHTPGPGVSSETFALETDV